MSDDDVNRILTRTETFDRDVVEETSTYLMDAAALGETGRVRALLARGADPNIVSVYAGRTALLAAARLGHAEIVDLLIAAGADIYAVERYTGQSVFDYATTHAHVPIVRSLLAAGARPLFRRVNFSIAGGAAARDVIRLLVEHGGDINLIDDWGRTPLMWAAQYAELETVAMMIALGADVHRHTEPNMNGVNTHDTALSLARRGKRADVIALLTRHGASEGRSTSIFDRLWSAFGG